MGCSTSKKIGITTATTTAQQQPWIHLSEDSYKSIRLVDLDAALQRDYKGNFRFVESCAHNEEFDRLRNDGKALVYVPVQDEHCHLFIYSFDVNSKPAVYPHHNRHSIECNFEGQVIAQAVDRTDGNPVMDGLDELTCFGADLSTNGILWLSIFNKNLIIGFDVRSNCVVYQFHSVPAPNDLTVAPSSSSSTALHTASNPLSDPQQPVDIIYVACGKSFRFNKLNKYLPLNQLEFVQPTTGQIVQLVAYLQPRSAAAGANPSTKATMIDIASPLMNNNSNNNTSDIYKVVWDSEMTALAGIVHSDNVLYYSQLYDMRSLPLRATSPTAVSAVVPAQLWRGTDVDATDNCYLLDNLSEWKRNKVKKKATAKAPSMKSSSTRAAAASAAISKVATAVMGSYRSARAATAAATGEQATATAADEQATAAATATADEQATAKSTSTGALVATATADEQAIAKAVTAAITTDEQATPIDIETTTTRFLLGAIYRKVDKVDSQMMQKREWTAFSWVIARFLYCIACCACDLTNAELPLEASKLDTFRDICFVVMKPHRICDVSDSDSDSIANTQSVCSVESIHFKLTNLQRYIAPIVKQSSNKAYPSIAVTGSANENEEEELVDGHVTDISVHKNTFIFINFTTSQIILMDSKEVQSIIEEKMS